MKKKKDDRVMIMDDDRDKLKDPSKTTIKL
jgi:hypothetical protein